MARSVRARAVRAVEDDSPGLPSHGGAGHENLPAPPARLHEDAAGHRLVEHHPADRLPRPGSQKMTEKTLATMRVPFVDLQAQHAPLREEMERAFRGLLDRGDFILGAAVEAFEAEYAAFIGTKHAVGVGNGLSAIELALRAHGISAGDEVITPANTFIATVLAIIGVGATPVFVDMDPATYLIDPRAIAAAVTARTRAIVPVHLYGQPIDLDAVMAVAGRHDLLVVEDAAQAHGA